MIYTGNFISARQLVGSYKGRGGKETKEDGKREKKGVYKKLR